MTLLLGWSAVNLVGGTTGYLLADGPRAEGFWAGNAAWNTVNAAIAVTGLATLPARRAEPWDEATARRQTDMFERALLVNVGLDVAYVTSGLWLGERGRRKGDQRLQGLGDALIVQGGFLLLFDVGLVVLSSRISRDLR